MAIGWIRSAKELFRQRTQPPKKCKQCGGNHYKHSSFCSDKCTRKYIEAKKS